MTLPAALLHGNRTKVIVAAFVAVGAYLYFRRRFGGGGGGSGVIDPTSLIPPAVDGALSAASDTTAPSETFDYALDDNGNPVITYNGTNLRQIISDLGAIGAIGVIHGTSNAGGAGVDGRAGADAPPDPLPPPQTVAPVVTPTAPGPAGQVPASANARIAQAVAGVTPQAGWYAKANAKLVQLGQSPHGAVGD